jgi:hypothetical protein
MLLPPGAPPMVLPAAAKKVSKALPGLLMEGNDCPAPSALTQIPRPVAVEEKASPAPICLARKRSMEMPPGGPRICETLGWVLSFTVRVACWLPCSALLKGLKNLDMIVIRLLCAASGMNTGARSKSVALRLAQV